MKTIVAVKTGLSDVHVPILRESTMPDSGLDHKPKEPAPSALAPSTPAPSASLPAAPSASAWNSLEVAKLLVGALTPIAIVIFTFWTDRIQTRETINLANQRQKEEASRHSNEKDEEIKRHNNEKEEDQKSERFAQVVKYRVALWEKISPRMNDIYTYFLYVGQWKDLYPIDILNAKRELDKLIYSNRPFFTIGFLSRYDTFMSETFLMGNAWKVDAKLKSPPIRDKDRGHEDMFAKSPDGHYIENTSKIHAAYFDWLSFAAQEMDLEISPLPKPSTPSPEEITERLPATDAAR